MWIVRFLDDAQAERSELSSRDRMALNAAVEKLRAEGPALGAPFSSSIVGAGETLRELRPRQGRSRFRALYRRVGDELVIAAIGPEAAVDRRGFDRAIRAAIDRLAAAVVAEGGTK